MEPKPPDQQRRRLLTWLWRLPVVAALAGLGYGLYEAGTVIFGKTPASERPSFSPIPPVAISALDNFASPWDSVTFEARGIPAVALRLPPGAPEVAGGVSQDEVRLAAYSRICTHQRCTVSLNRDLEAIAFGFNYRADAPQLVCPCHLSVFSPVQGGRAVSGPAVEPLPRIELRIEAGRVLAVGVEETS